METLGLCARRLVVGSRRLHSHLCAVTTLAVSRSCSAVAQSWTAERQSFSGLGGQAFAWAASVPCIDRAVPCGAMSPSPDRHVHHVSAHLSLPPLR